MGTWLTTTCEECGEYMWYLPEWDVVPRFCKGCRYYEEYCEICGRPMKIGRAWEHPPRVHKECREAKAVEWERHTCLACGEMFSVHRSWNRKSAYCKNCEWYDVTCLLCDQPIRVSRNWEHTPHLHKECRDEVRPRDVQCAQCEAIFTLSTGVQIKCRKNGWKLPSRCWQCKEDAALIQGAIGALRDQFPFPLETAIEKRGVLVKDKVAVVRNRRTGQVVAEVTVGSQGILVKKRVATVTNMKTKERVSKTEHGSHGIIFPQPTVDTYDAKRRQMTHRSKVVQRGIIRPTKVMETQSVVPGAMVPARMLNEPGRGWPSDENDYVHR